MPEDKCATKRCRGEIAVIYLGTPLCQECYEKVCDEEDTSCNLCKGKLITEREKQMKICDKCDKLTTNIIPEEES